MLVETAIVGREIEVAMLEGRDGRRPRASLPGEIVLTTREFYDFEGKYLGGDGVERRVPGRSRRDAEIAAIQELGIRAFDAVDGAGLARVDFFLTADGALRQRAEHDARLHADLDVPEVLDRVGDDLPRADHGAHRHGAGARARIVARRVATSVQTRCRCWGSTLTICDEPVEHLRARDDVVVEVDLDRGRAAERRDAVARGVGLVDRPSRRRSTRAARERRRAELGRHRT